MPTPRNIIVRHEPPPIPCKDFDYMASRADWDLGEPIGFGPTPELAIADLLEEEENRKEWAGGA